MGEDDVNIIVPHLFIETVQLSECENKMSFNQHVVFILLCLSIICYSETNVITYKIYHTHMK